MTVPITSIIVADGRRPLRDVAELAASIAEVGLLNPITVTHEHRLIAGYHRLEACKSLGWLEIPVSVVTLSAEDAELAEIDENLVRHELTALERCEQLLRRKKIYEAKYPETRRGVAGGKARQGLASETVSFADDAAEKMGVSKRTVQQDIQIAEKLSADVRDCIRDTWIEDDKTFLLELARAGESVQKMIAEKALVGKRMSHFIETCLVIEAIRDEQLYKSEYATFDDYFRLEIVTPEDAYGFDGDGDKIITIGHELSGLLKDDGGDTCSLQELKRVRTRYDPPLRFYWNNQSQREAARNEYRRSGAKT
jgi:ParB family chromosome partitioning protein